MDKHNSLYSEEDRYKFAKFIVNKIMQNSFISTEVYGKENLPDDGGYVMYSNHQGKFDMVGIMYGHEKPCTVVMDEVRSNLPIMKPFLSVVQGSTLDRNDMRSQATTIKKLINEVNEGRKYVIFPEGGYDHNGNNLQVFKPGSFKISMRTKTPIVPVALVDSYVPYSYNSLRKVTTQVHYLQPISYEEYKDMKTEDIALMVRDRIEAKVKEQLSIKKRRYFYDKRIRQVA
ncbi:MAG: 1-acyl-sn-glycerol-3-phosphate acyltransferase [Lachnospiraceae bacterium]|nr:1-acyl-sn-glycerol-3-phosphate acyltransferase [Lachnospiraceae bacterium]